MHFSPTRAILAAVLAAAASGLFAQEQAEGVKLAAELDLALQYRYRSSDMLVEDYQDKSGIDLQRDYFDVPPLASGSLDLGDTQGLAVGLGAELRREFNSDNDEGYFQSMNFDFVGRSRDPIAMEKAAITRGVLYWRSPSIDLALGRDRVDYGKELEGTLYPSSRLPYLDAFRAQGRLGPFTLDWMVATIDAVKAFKGVDVDPNWVHDPNSADLNSDGVLDDPTAYGFEDGTNPTTILEALHRLSWNFGKFRVGLAENCIVARRNNRILIQDVLPLVSWHQASVMPNNMTLYWDIAWEPAPGLSFAAEGGYDDINANIFGVGDSEVPTIDAYVLGGRYRSDEGRGSLDAYFEAGYTHYLWGNFSAYKQGDITDVDPLARAIYRFRLNDGGALLSLTSPYGPGALWLRLEGGCRPWADLGPRIGAELLLLSKNKEANLIDTPYDQSAKDGDRLFFGSLTLPVSWTLGAFELSAAPAALVRNQTWWVEATITAVYRYRAETFLRKPGI
jgi:hypothetical protein